MANAVATAAAIAIRHWPDLLADDEIAPVQYYDGFFRPFFLTRIIILADGYHFGVDAPNIARPMQKR